MADRPILFDVQAAQSVHERHRGIPRYAVELGLALYAQAPQRIGAFLCNPDLALPEAADQFLATGRLRFSDGVDWDAAGLLHITSPLMTVPLDRLLPPAARAAGVPFVVTCHDLIPELFPEHYLEDPGWRRRYRSRLELIRAAAGVLTPSEATRRDVVEQLVVDPERVHAVGEGTGPQFVPPGSRPAAAARAAAALPGLRTPFVFSISGAERRKNMEPLLGAWAQLAPEIRSGWQLAVCCTGTWSERYHLRHVADQMGLGDDVLITGFVPEEALVALYQGTDLFVFPSIYEGYGLPVAEALACGAAVLAADASSLPELVPPEALFDLTDAARIAAAIAAALTDGGLRQRLLAHSGHPPSTWSQAATATLGAYDAILDRQAALPGRRRRPGGQRPPRPVLAFATPLAGEAAAYNRQVIDHLGRLADVHVFTDGEGPPPPGVLVHPVASLERVDGLTAGFDGVIYSLADDDHHVGCLATFRRRPGVVLAHDARLAGLYARAVRAGAVWGHLPAVLTASYGDVIPETLGAGDELDGAEARRRGVVMARDVAARAPRVLYLRAADADLARFDAAAADRPKIGVVAAGGDGRPDPGRVAEALYEALGGGG